MLSGKDGIFGDDFFSKDGFFFFFSELFSVDDHYLICFCVSSLGVF
jgi:hypothetical protein